MSINQIKRYVEREQTKSSTDSSEEFEIPYQEVIRKLSKQPELDFLFSEKIDFGDAFVSLHHPGSIKYCYSNLGSHVTYYYGPNTLAQCPMDKALKLFPHFVDNEISKHNYLALMNSIFNPKLTIGSFVDVHKGEFKGNEGFIIGYRHDSNIVVLHRNSAIICDCMLKKREFFFDSKLDEIIKNVVKNTCGYAEERVIKELKWF